MNFRFLLVVAYVLTGYYLAREPLARPSKATVLSWIHGREIVVVPVTDFHPPIFERLDSAKVLELKHVSGTTYRRVWFPQHGSATYSFCYPHESKLNTYKLRLSYNWTIKIGWILREPEDIAIVGPRPTGRVE